MIVVKLHGGQWRCPLDEIEPAAMATLLSTCAAACKIPRTPGVFGQFVEIFRAPFSDHEIDFNPLTLTEVNIVFSGFGALAHGFLTHGCPHGATFCRGVCQVCQVDAVQRFDHCGRNTPYLN